MRLAASAAVQHDWAMERDGVKLISHQAGQVAWAGLGQLPSSLAGPGCR